MNLFQENIVFVKLWLFIIFGSMLILFVLYRWAEEVIGGWVRRYRRRKMIRNMSKDEATKMYQEGNISFDEYNKVLDRR